MGTAERSIIIHGHFYQPPREDPWLDLVEAEPSAAPFHDWNQLIDRECYRAVVAARVLAADARIARVMNTLEWMSFNVGPTLLDWLEREACDTYEAILEADRRSVARLGHGNAMGMPYHHAILPLSSRRDKVTEIRWGIANFRKRFGRDPEGMWLPETAVDHETLDILATEGVRFTVLAPHQVVRAPAGGRPGTYRSPSGRELVVFVYDGPMSHDIAFGNLLQDAQAWSERFLSLGGDRPLISVATDGETYGHHHRFGEMALAALFDRLERRPDVQVENFASYLAAHPPTESVEIVAPSSWSCAHGVERWRADCGCKLAPGKPTQQRWRDPLRRGIDWLAQELHAVFEGEGRVLFRDPWAARDAYGAVGNRVEGGADVDTRAVFLEDWLIPNTDANQQSRALELAEMERDALRMFTSCGWFFDDIGGIETMQVLRYAAHGIELAGAEHRERLEAGLLAYLSEAQSNDRAVGNGRDLYLSKIKPSVPAAPRVAAGYIAALEAGGDPKRLSVPAYDVRATDGRVTLTHHRVGRVAAFDVTVERQGTTALSVVVSDDGTPPRRLGFHDLTEHHRSLLARLLRSRLAERWLKPEERDLAGTGVVPFESVLRQAIIRAVADVDHPDGVTRVLGLIELLSVAGVKMPFDAQTRFARVLDRLPVEDVVALEPLRRAMGFTEPGGG